MMVKRKLDGTVDESSADWEIRKSDATACYLHTVLQNIWVKVGVDGIGKYLITVYKIKILQYN